MQMQHHFLTKTIQFPKNIAIEIKTDPTFHTIFLSQHQLKNTNIRFQCVPSVPHRRHAEKEFQNPHLIIKILK